MYDALKVANYLLYKASGRLTPMQTIKLVYFAHGWTLRLTNGKPLINESVQAWRWGPVIRSVYDTHKHHGNNFIGGANKKATKDIDKYHQAILDRVLEVYGHKSGLELSAQTHQEGTPWHTVYVVQKQNWGRAHIPNDLIREYFERVLKSKKDE